MVDAERIKEQILSSLKIRGPSIPVHLATEIKSSILFTSAFLSELVSEKKVKMSNMRIGSSPIYFLPGQETMLEKFSEHLKSKEKEAFLLLKENGFLIDSTQQPAIRVALRGIRDFALPFKSQDSIIWRYFLVPETEYKPKGLVREEKPTETEIKKEPEKILEVSKKPRERRKAVKRAKPQQKEKFFGRVKEFLTEKAMELKDKVKILPGEYLSVPSEKKNYIGQIGFVVGLGDDYVRVKFSDGEWWDFQEMDLELVE